MRVNDLKAGGRPARLLVLVSVVVAACATGVDPVRLGGEGGSGGSGPSGPSSSSPSSSVGSASSSSSSVSVSSSGSAVSSSSSAASSSSSSSGGPVMGLKVQYRCADTNQTDNQMKPHFSVVNGGNASVSLASLKIRYYFTIDPGATTLQFNCDYAAPGAGACGNISSSFGMVAGASTDHYLEVGFSSGNLAPGAATGEIQARINKSDYSQCNQANDYSFDPTKVGFMDWTKVTLYQSGSLVWGMEP